MALTDPKIEFNLPRSKEELDNYYKTKYRYTQKEKDILVDCYNEAFYYHVLPLGIGFGLFTEFAIQNDFIKPHRWLRALPISLFATFCGAFLGIVSARNACNDKLRQTSDSMYGRYLMHKKYGRYDFQYESTKLRNTYLNSVSNSSGVKFSQPNALNLDLDRPDVKDSDEYRRFPNDDAVEIMPDADQPKPSVTYAQLRKQNRDAHANTTERL